MQIELHQQRVLEYLLWEKFYFHYMMIGRDKTKINFYKWLYYYKFISRYHCKLLILSERSKGKG